jgi:phosphatidylserine/phosphatidylglycerophosphate/cardiolipin synthase-like enzyme
LESSFYKGDLSQIIPTIYSLSTPGTSVYVLSPWLNIHVEVIIPWKKTDNEKPFIEFVVSERRRGVDSVFFVSTMARDDKETQRSITELTGLEFRIKVIENLHSKAVIGNLLMYRGSANITYNGLYNNIESVTMTVVNNQEEALRGLLA